MLPITVVTAVSPNQPSIILNRKRKALNQPAPLVKPQQQVLKKPNRKYKDAYLHYAGESEVYNDIGNRQKRIKFCEKKKPVEQMVTVSGYFPPIVACRDCEKHLQ
ncbi:hypothetical protein ACFLUG_04220 [Chloroflexota bacterium]